MNDSFVLHMGIRCLDPKWVNSDPPKEAFVSGYRDSPALLNAYHKVLSGKVWESCAGAPHNSTAARQDPLIVEKVKVGHVLYRSQPKPWLKGRGDRDSNPRSNLNVA